MQLWRLTPIDLSDPHWEASVYRAPVTVRAETEERAREIAALAFGTAVRVWPSKGPRYVPWRHTALVACRTLEDASFKREGPEEILDPADYDQDWRG